MSFIDFDTELYFTSKSVEEQQRVQTKDELCLHSSLMKPLVCYSSDIELKRVDLNDKRLFLKGK